MWNARLDEAQGGIKIAGRNINNLRYADDTTLMAESEEDLKNLLRRVKEESEKAGLKLNIQKKILCFTLGLDAWDKCSDLVHWEEPEGSGREGGGRGDRDGECM